MKFYGKMLAVKKIFYYFCGQLELTLLIIYDYVLDT